jgi:O-antigen/teichoic acid export membrane protein
MWELLTSSWSKIAARGALHADGFGDREEVAADAARLTAAQLLSAVVGLATSALAARWLGPAAFGTAAVVMAYPSVVGAFFAAKTSPITLRYAAGFLARGRPNEVLAVCKLGYGVDFALASGASGIVATVALVSGSLPGASKHAGLVAAFALARPFISFRNTSLTILSVLRRFAVASVLYISDRLLVLLCVVGALAFHAGVAELVIATAVGQLLGGLAWLLSSSVILRRAVGDWWGARWSLLREFRAELRSMLSWNFLGATFGGALTQGSVILLGALHSAVDAGYFRLASSLATTADYGEVALIRVVSAPLAEAHALGDRAKFRRLIAGWMTREGPVAALLVVIGMAALPLVVPLVFGSDYTPMVLGAEVMLLGIAVSTALFFVTPALYAQGRVRTWVLANGGYATLTLGIGAAAAASHGFLAFALLTGLGMVAMNIVLVILVTRGTSKEARDFTWAGPGGRVGGDDRSPVPGRGEATGGQDEQLERRSPRV